MGMRTFVVGFGVTVVLTIVFLAFGDQRPKLRTLVSETHRQLKDNLRTIKDRLDEAARIDENLVADDKYLSLLGLGRDGRRRSYPDDVWTNTSLPVIVSYVNSGSLSQGVGLARNIQRYLRNHSLLLYDLGLSRRQLQTLASFCNSSRCSTVSFDLSKFPPHVSDRHLHAFRPLIIQDAISRSGAVFYLENDQRLTTRDISPLITRAASTGALSWRGSRPVTALTHPRMLRYLAFSSPSGDSLLFTPMVVATRLVLYNTPDIRDGLMLPWVKCSLNHDCILPLGAQSVGCHFDKKPVYRYSGCHENDASALSVLLGLVFKFDTDKYSVKLEEDELLDTATDSSSTDLSSSSTRSLPPYHHSSVSPDGSGAYFRRVDSTEAALELSLLMDNTTETSSGS